MTHGSRTVTWINSTGYERRTKNKKGQSEGLVGSDFQSTLKDTYENDAESTVNLLRLRLLDTASRRHLLSVGSG